LNFGGRVLKVCSATRLHEGACVRIVRPAQQGGSGSDWAFLRARADRSRGVDASINAVIAAIHKPVVVYFGSVAAFPGRSALDRAVGDGVRVIRGATRLRIARAGTASQDDRPGGVDEVQGQPAARSAVQWGSAIGRGGS